jgi:hypothetical protein
MTQVFTIEPNPHWVIIDNFSKLPNGAAIYTYRTLNPSEFKPAFQDAGGTIPYGQPITGFGNGTMPPIFWEFDDTAPDDTYYIRVYDKPMDQGGVFLWDFDGLSGGTSGGGGSTITNNDVENLVVNGSFYRNIGDQVGSPSVATFITLAPSNNAGFVGYANNANDGPVAPDIIFAKNNQSDSDNINFVTVNPIGTNNLGSNPTPQIYVKYNCTVGGAALAYKYIQFPIVKGLQNLSGSTVSIQIFARLVSGNPNDVTLNLRQFFGNGGSPSADVLTPIGGGPLNLVLGSWSTIIINSQTIPSIASGVLGSCGNDALFMQIAFPLTDPINIDFILPSMYLGAMTSNFDFHTLDEVDAIVNSPRTGDTRTSLNAFMLGWVNMNDGTIGSASSNASARSNIDTFPLFDLIWNTFQANQALAPMYTNGSVAVAYGANSVTDFTANRQLSLTKSLGRVMAGALPVQISQSFTNTGNTLTVTSTASFFTGVPVVVSGGSLPTPLVAGTTYYSIQLTLTTFQLASSYANAIASTPIVLTSNASGTVMVAAHVLGSVIGDETHVMSVGEMPSHDHNIPGLIQNYCAGGNASTYNTTGPPGTTNTSFTGGGAPFNIMQPTVYMNVFIKL